MATVANEADIELANQLLHGKVTMPCHMTVTTDTNTESNSWVGLPDCWRSTPQKRVTYDYPPTMPFARNAGLPLSHAELTGHGCSSADDNELILRHVPEFLRAK